MKAILSDIHSNLEALQAVLQDIAKHDVQEIYCLGDMIGYGPNPRECLDLAMAWQVSLLGNHDHAVMFGPRGFMPHAERAVRWTRVQLELPDARPEAALQRWEFLAGRPRSHREDGYLFVHASPRDYLAEYVFPEDVYNMGKMQGIFDLVQRYCFMGHTHMPGIFTESVQFLSPEEIGYVHQLDGTKTLCNVGSVGQPRDGDWRACYVLLDGDTIRFRRVEYDIATAVKKVEDTPELEQGA